MNVGVSVEKKCEKCVFCMPKPENMSFMPNDWICGRMQSKWYGYWPHAGACELYTEPTGKAIGEVLSDNDKKNIQIVMDLLSSIWGECCEEHVDDISKFVDEFVKQDIATLNDYEK